MENKMQIFENAQFGKLRTVEIDGVPWFVGKDVAQALGYVNHKKALGDHVAEDDKLQGDGVTIRDPIGRAQHPVVINESGVYSMIFSSKLEGAKQFKHWVTSEVLPSIRKYGAYMTDDLLEQAAVNSDVAAKVAKALFEERSLNKKLAGQLQLTEAQLTLALPKAAYYDALVDAPNCTGIRLTAKELGVSQSMFTSYLVRKEYAYYDQKGKMHPVALAYRNGLFVVREYIAQNGHRGTQMLVTPKGTPVTMPAEETKPVSQEEINEALIRWNGSSESKQRVQDYMTAHARERGTAQWLKDEFGGADSFSAVTDHGTAELSWAKVQRQLGMLVAEDRFLTEVDRMLMQSAENEVPVEENTEETASVDTVPAEQAELSEKEDISQPENNDDLLGVELTIEDRRFVVDEIRGDTASLRDITFQNNVGFPVFRDMSMDEVRGWLNPTHIEVPKVNLEAELTEAELDLLRPQLDAAGIDYLVVNAGYNARTISFSSEHYNEVQAMLDALPENPELPQNTATVYLGDKTGLPYDIVLEPLRAEREPEPTPVEDLAANPISVQIDGEWQTFPNQGAAEAAMFEEYKRQSHRNAENFRITDDALGVGGAKTKYQANVAAIRLLKELETSDLQATPEQQEILSKYVGWGGLADAFDPDKAKWSAEYAELQSLLTPEEYEAARASTLNAHYTSPVVIHAMYEALERMGFQNGNILEPAMGVGNFFGCLPEGMKDSRLYGVELDSITGRIAKQLYPKANITVAGYETTDRRDFYDIAIGNVPFGQYQVNDRAYNKLGFSIHDYFFAKTLDQVRPGGVIAFVTSRYTMDKQSPEVRKYIAQRADFLGAIRLPNNAFRANAGTDVVSDIIFLQHRDRPIEIAPDWVHLGQNEDGFNINSYFVEHPEMILGRQSSESTQYGREDFTVEPIEKWF